MASHPTKHQEAVRDRRRSPDAGNGQGPLRYQRVVVKAGTSVLTGGSDRLDMDVMSDLAAQIAGIHSAGVAVLLVTSGAVAAGRHSLGFPRERRDIPFRQVLAAVGQGRLMHAYEQFFAEHGVKVAQAVLTYTDLSDRQGYLNVRNTLLALLELGVVPILNENDVVAVDEIGEVFGDNDRLSALVANLVDADLLAILTDTEGLYTDDPRTNAEAQLLRRVERVDASVEAMARGHRNAQSRGGMPTKLEAAKLATSSGITTVICDGREEGLLQRLTTGEEVGTLFPPTASRMESRKRWMLSGLSARGEIVVDEGAAAALQNRHRSLLPAGVKGVGGQFRRGDIVYIMGPGAGKVACGIANYSSGDVEKVKGSRSDRILGLLGYHYGEEVVHRNNMVLL